MSLSRSTPLPAYSAVSSSSLLKVPSSLAACDHGMFAAVGMWPGRCDCSCGRCAGASSRPEYSSGRAHVDQVLLADGRLDLVAERADRAVLVLRGVRRRRALVDRLDQLAGVELPLLAAAVEQPDVVVAVELEVPVGVGREPVVVAAVQHDRVVVADALRGQQRLELLLAHEVAADRVLQVLLPVQADRAPDVVLVVGGGVLVDLDEHHLRVVEVGLDPVGVDEDSFAVLGAHA